MFSGYLLDAGGNPVADFPAEDVELVIDSPCANPVLLNPAGNSDANGQVFRMDLHRY
jgi:hypothetical protein